MPADLKVYTSFTYDRSLPQYAVWEDVFWEALKDIGQWVETSVANGWTFLHYTAIDNPVDPGDTDLGEPLHRNGTPTDILADAYAAGTGYVPTQPWLDTNGGETNDDNVSYGRTIYLRYDDGGGSVQNENIFDFFISVQLQPDGYVNAYRMPTLRLGPLLEPFVEPAHFGSAPYIPTYDNTTGWGSPPSDPVQGLYTRFPAPGSHTAPDPFDPGFSPVWGFDSQPGYSAQVIATHCAEPNGITPGTHDDNITFHVYAGFEHNQPYLYIVIETQMFNVTHQKWFAHTSHLGLGVIRKSGVGAGGQFCVSTYDNDNDNYWHSPGSDYKCMLFDGRLTTDATDAGNYHIDAAGSSGRGRSSIWLGTDPTNLVRFQFGVVNQVWGEVRGFLTLPWYNNIERFSGRTIRRPLWDIYISYQDLNDDFFLIGTPPGIRHCHVNGIAPSGKEFTDSGSTKFDVWLLRAQADHAGESDRPTSQKYGVAYRKP